MDFEDFHIVAVKETSDRLAALFRKAAIRIHQCEINEIGRPEYVIAVYVDDMDQAGQIFSSDIGPGRTYTSGAE